MIGLYTCFDVHDDGTYVVQVEAIVKFNNEDYATLRWFDDSAITFEPIYKLVESCTFFDDAEKCLAYYKPKETTND